MEIAITLTNETQASNLPTVDFVTIQLFVISPDHPDILAKMSRTEDNKLVYMYTSLIAGEEDHILVRDLFNEHISSFLRSIGCDHHVENTTTITPYNSHFNCKAWAHMINS